MPSEGAAIRGQDVLARAFQDRLLREGTTLRLSANGGKVVMEVLRALDADGLDPASLAVREPSMDDVFLALTGGHAEPADDGEPAQAAQAGGRRGAG